MVILIIQIITTPNGTLGFKLLQNYIRDEEIHNTT
jgi:hypothetical protein